MLYFQLRGNVSSHALNSLSSALARFRTSRAASRSDVRDFEARVRTSLHFACKVATLRFKRAHVVGRLSLVPKLIHHVTPRIGGEQETRQLTT